MLNSLEQDRKTFDITHRTATTTEGEREIIKRQKQLHRVAQPVMPRVETSCNSGRSSQWLTGRTEHTHRQHTDTHWETVTDEHSAIPTGGLCQQHSRLSWPSLTASRRQSTRTPVRETEREKAEEGKRGREEESSLQYDWSRRKALDCC